MEEEIYYKGYRILIKPDEFAGSPDSWSDDGLFLIYNHRDFCIRKTGFDPEDIYNNPEEYSDFYIFPVEAYIHSGVRLSLFNGAKTCRWDSSVSGYVIADKNEFTEDAAVKAAEGLIEYWNDYLSEYVWGYIVEKPETIYSISKEKFDRLLFENDLANLEQEFHVEDTWEYIDSCWGFYGDPEKSGCIGEAKHFIDYLINKDGKS